MRRTFFHIILILFFSSFSFQLIAGNTDPFFIQHFDNRNGLSNSSINKLFKDSDDILWIATWDGLNMYDGTNFHVFNYSKEKDSKSIGSNVIQNITEDKSGNIWITTIEGISRYDKSSGKFTNYFYNLHRTGKLSEQEYAIAVDTAGMVYCLNQKTGLSYYDIATDSFKASLLPLRNARITKLSFDENNHLWLLNSNGQLDKCSGRKDKFNLLYTYGKKEFITDFFQANSRFFFTSSDNKLYSILDKTGEQQPVLQLPNPINHMIFYNEHYFFAWANKGYGVYESDFSPSAFLKTESKQMQDLKITSWELGTENILWYGTDGNGLIKIYPRTNYFGTVTTSEINRSYNKSVRAFCRENNNLWVGTKGSGIIQYKNFWSLKDEETADQKSITTPYLDNNSVFALKKGNDDLIYIGSDGQGLTIYDLKTKQFTKWNAIKGHEAFPDFRSVYAIFQETDNSLWIGTSGYGLIHLKIKKNEDGNLAIQFLEKYTSDNSDAGPANDIIYSITPGNTNQLWIGCRYGGLSLLNKKTKKFKTFKAFTYEGSLSNNDVLSVFKDSHDRIWVGTSYGLNWLEEKDALKAEPVFQKLTTINGLPNNTIHAIEEDRAGQIWVSTNKGLARLNPENLEISYYQQSDGLQSNEFGDGAVWKDNQDNLFFGGTYGFNNFLPQNITKSTWLPNLIVDGISLGGRKADENGFIVLKPMEENKHHQYTIDRNENYIELNIRSLSFLNSEKSEYAYYLEGYNKEWYYAGKNGKLTFSNILPGDYNLKIKWSNGDGTWTEPTSFITLKVKQYPWMTTYASMGYFIILFILGFLFYRYRKNKLEIRHQLEVEHLLRKKEEELHQNRLGFFTNIAHELQTPLTLIMGASERQKEITIPEKNRSGINYFPTLIHQQASKLTYLVQQLLEFRKVEAGFLKNKFSHGNISDFLYNLTEPFMVLSDQLNRSFELDIESKMTGWIDKDKIEKIAYNLLSNAFKYSGKNEQIVFVSKINKENNFLEIIVSNSGIDMNAEQAEKLFDQFYSASGIQSQTDKFGTGIGLAFARQLVNMINGNIKAESKSGWIHFKVNLPISADNNGFHAPLQNEKLNEQPSYLFQTITNYSELKQPESAMDNNKEAIIADLLNEEKKKILIVEDEAEIRFLLKDILKEDYIIYEAEDGKNALEFVEKIMPALVICDVMMPNMNGLELCYKMKETISTCQIPFILLSARGSEEQHMEGYESGADAYIDKPFNAAHLKLRIRKLLEYREKLHSLFNNNQNNDLNHLKEPEIEDVDKTFLTAVVKVIEENISSEDLNAAFLEKEFFLSKMQLYRKLKSLTNMTPGEFIKSIRLITTANLLRSTNLNVLEIFFRTGFNNQSYFFREFKKRFQCSPNEYREQNQITG